MVAAVPGVFDIAIPEAIASVLKKQDAEEEFRIVRELLAKYFPETLAFRPFLEGDFDDRNRMIVVMRIVLPEELATVPFADRNGGYFRELVQRLPNPKEGTCIRYFEFESTENAMG